MASVYIHAIKILNCFQKKPSLYRSDLFKHIKSFKSGCLNFFLLHFICSPSCISFTIKYNNEYGQSSKHTAKMKVYILLSVLSLNAGEYDYIYKTVKLNLTKNLQLLSNRGTFNGFDE